MNVPLKRRTVRMERHVGADAHQLVVEGSFALPAHMPDIARVIRLEAHPVITDRSVLEDEVIVHGGVDFTIVYAHDEPVPSPPRRTSSDGEPPAVRPVEARPVDPLATEIEAERGFAAEDAPEERSRPGRRHRDRARHPDDYPHHDEHHDADDHLHHDDYHHGGRGHHPPFDDEGDEPAEGREVLYRHRWRRGATFETVFDIPGAREGMVTDLRTEPLDIDVHLHSNGRGIDMEAVLGVALRVGVDDTQDVAVKGRDFPTSVEATEGRVPVENVFARGRTSVSVEGSLPLSAEHPAKTVADIRASVHVEETGIEWSDEGETARLYGKGTVAYKAVVVDEYGEPDAYAWQHQTPFSFSAEAYDVQPGDPKGVRVEAEAAVRGLDAAPGSDGRAIEVFVDIDIGARAVRVEPLVFVVELDGGDEWDIRSRTETFRLEQWIGRQDREGAAVGQLDLPPGHPPIDRVLSADATARVEDVLVLGDKVIVEGRFDVSGMYVARTDGRPVHAVRWDGPLTLEVEVDVAGAEPGMEADVKVHVADVKLDLYNRETVEATVRFVAEAKVTHPTEREAVVEAVAVPPPEEDPPTFTFVVVQPDDTLWKLSHRYHTDVDAIVRANPSLGGPNDELTPGRKLCVPRQKPAPSTAAGS